jgi:hypothetical protein
MDREFIPVEGVFDKVESSVFTKYRVGIQFTELVMGGIPQNPDIIESWLFRILEGDAAEIEMMLRKTLNDLEIEVPANATKEEVMQAAKGVAATRNGNTFRRKRPDGLCIAAYQVKAMLKESTAILYAYNAKDKDGKHIGRWGPTFKSAMAFFAERVFVDDYLLPMGRQEPDGVHMQVGHVSGPQGKRSTLTYVDYCAQPTLSFTMSSSEDMITAAQWERILIQSQRTGLGAMRSLGHGQFKVTEFDKVA